MGKWGLFSVSCPAALVAGGLSVYLILVLVNYSPLEPTLLLIVVCTTLAASAFMTVLPVGILVFYPKTAPAAAGAGSAIAEGGGEEAGSAAESSASVETFDDAEDADEVEDLGDEEEELEDFGEEFDVEDAGEDDMFAEGEESGDFEDFDIDDFEDDER